MIKITHSGSQTESFGEKAAAGLKKGDVIALYGSLGSGKTAFVRGLCRGLKCRVDVHSPTFNIINFYPGDIEVAHVDLYRIASVDDFGWDDLFNGERIVIIEWAEKVKGNLPDKRIDIFFKIIDQYTREIELNTDHDTGN